jgi:hypothetical protein
VFDSNVYALTDGQFPALEIDQGEETSELSTIDGDEERTLALIVTASVKQTSGYRSTLNQMRKEVEIALAADRTLGGKCKDVALAGVEMDSSGEGETPTATATMRFNVTYFVDPAAPDVPL